MKASDLFVKCLVNEEVEYIFSVPGEENLDLLESLRKTKIKIWTADIDLLLINTGICALAPELNPITVNVAYNVLVVANSVGTAVAFPLQFKPITVSETAVPFVINGCVPWRAKDCAAALSSAPLPVNEPNTLLSDIVNW